MAKKTRTISGASSGNKRSKTSATKNRYRDVGSPSIGGAIPSLANSDDDIVLEGNETMETSSSEDEDFEASKVLPYKNLLQALSHDNGASRQPRKKRKPNPASPQPIETEADDIDVAAEDEEEDDPLSEDGIIMDEPEDTSDPFTRQFSGTDEANLEESIEAILKKKTQSKKQQWKNWGQIIATWSTEAPSLRTWQKSKVTHVKQRLKEVAERIFATADQTSEMLLPLMFNYHDVFFASRSLANAKSLREMSCLHILNHIIKTRDKVIKNSARMTKADNTTDDELRDQGFTRPKVLILLPTRQSCARYVQTIVDICQPEQQENKKRFQDSYSNIEDNLGDSKPADFRELFSGNDDDMFRIGLKVTRKTIKYFTQFYNSDVLLASPLGMRMAIGAEDSKKQDYDFLSSIEIAIVDQADAMSMQNWEHVEYIFEHLNLQPKEAHGCDFSRVRNWYLDGNAKYLRQTIVFSAFNFPSLNKLYTVFMQNTAGKIKFNQQEKGAMLAIGSAFARKQTFSRFDCRDLNAEPDARFRQFSTTMLPSVLRSVKTSGQNTPVGVLIFIPVYADFVKVRNYLAASNDCQDISFGLISEYTSVKEVTRARSHFMSGRHHALLYTERAHHFRRYGLKGVKKIFMYGLPENPTFYKEIAGDFLDMTVSTGQIAARDATVRSLFSRWDLLKLERIVGTGRHVSMMTEKAGDTFDFS